MDQKKKIFYTEDNYLLNDNNHWELERSEEEKEVSQEFCDNYQGYESCGGWQKIKTIKDVNGDVSIIMRASLSKDKKCKKIVTFAFLD